MIDEKYMTSKYEQECLPLFDTLKTLELKLDIDILLESMYCFNYFEEYEKCAIIKNVLNKYYPNENHDLPKNINGIRNPKDLVPSDFHERMTDILAKPYEDRIIEFFKNSKYKNCLLHSYESKLGINGWYSTTDDMEAFLPGIMENLRKKYSTFQKVHDETQAEGNEMYKVFNELKKIKPPLIDDKLHKTVKEINHQQDLNNEKRQKGNTELNKKREEGEARYERKKKIKSFLNGLLNFFDETD